MNHSSDKGTWVASVYLPEITDEQLQLTLELLEERFPGTWDNMMWERQQPFPKDKIPELRKVSKKTISSLWALVRDIDFVKQVQDEEARNSLSRALINAINQHANKKAKEK
ncbi:hypothetical protein [Hoeflea poritis]|uniref:Uncharacterized protein n=1 Tax=Hoeflea poritis TaxID=2993659 RepID=A0ABT4VUG3_9HYPH|nr:hypothetical protein [Hoeflea poritis]MDA4848352.1 hypothetical protein [Hoeflea poritis]